MRIAIQMGCCLCAVAALGSAPSGWAQSRKPGLWEITSKLSQGGKPSISRVCLTQQQIDKYGAPLPEMNGCRITKLVKNASSMTAEIACSGTMSGKVNLDSTATDSEHARGRVHFVGTVQDGPRTKPIEWTIDSLSVYKGPRCGEVKPLPMPAN